MRILTGYLQQTASLVSHAPSGMLLAVFVRVLLFVRAYAIPLTPLTHTRIRGIRMDGPRTTRSPRTDGRSSAANAASSRLMGARQPQRFVAALSADLAPLLGSGETWSRTVFDLHRGGL